jgi:hypothetical protein
VRGSFLRVALKRGRDLADVAALRDSAQVQCEPPSVFEGLVRALGYDGDHRMGGVATEGNRPATEAVQGRDVAYEPDQRVPLFPETDIDGVVNSRIADVADQLPGEPAWPGRR